MVAPLVTRLLVDPARTRLSKWHRDVAAYGSEISDTQWLSENELEALQTKKLRRLCVRAAQHCDYYRQLFADSSLDPEALTLADLSTLPALERETIRTQFDGIRDERFDSGELTDRSSGGSTGEPVHVLRTQQSFIAGKAFRARNYAWTGWRPGDPHHWFWGAYLDAPEASLKERVQAWLYNEDYINAFTISDALFKGYYDQASKRPPFLLESYSNILFEFARFIDRTGREPLNIPAIISSAGKLFDFQRILIRRTVGDKIFDRYGCREMDTIAQECDKNEGLHINMERFVVEVDEPDADGFGDLLVTDLASEGFPLIRYRIQDRGRLGSQPCSCGRGLKLLAELQGRTVDTVRTPSGKVISGALFPQIFIRFPKIVLGQVVQRTLDSLEIRIKVDGGFSDEEIAQLKGELLPYVGPDVMMDVRVVSELISNPTQKYRFVISEL